MVVATGNRVTAAIGRAEARIKALNGVGLNGKSLSQVDKDDTLALDEFVAYQNAQALAHATGKLTTEEAQTVYMALGGESYHGDWPKGTSLAGKIVVAQLMGELLGVGR